MISGLICVEHPGAPEAIDRLADTLSALVEGVAAGLVADAVIVAPRQDGALVTVAEGAGVRLVLDLGKLSPWHAAAPVARHDWVLCLDAGDVPQEGWIRTLDRFVRVDRPEIALGRLRRVGGLSRGGKIVDAILGARMPHAGDLVRRERLLGNAPFRPRLKPQMLQAQLFRG